MTEEIRDLFIAGDAASALQRMAPLDVVSFRVEQTVRS
jgi:hypothetical protein